MWHTFDGMGWWMLWGGLMMVLFWGAVIGLVVWAVQSLARQGGPREEPRGAEPRAGPLEIARERYARGEIGREEFEQIVRDLKES